MNILKTVLLAFGISLLVSACAEDTIGNNGSAGSTAANVAPTLAGPYIGENSTYGNNSQDYSYMKELVTIDPDNYSGGTDGHPMLANYFNRGYAAYSSIHNNWFDWNSIDVHGGAENNMQILPDANGVQGTNATKQGVRFPHSYHQDIAKYTDLIGNCTTNCHIRFTDAPTLPYNVSPACSPEAAPGVPPATFNGTWEEYVAQCKQNNKHSKIVFDRKVQVGDSSYQTNKAHDFCWSCHANLPYPYRAPHGFIVTSDNVSHQPNGSCSHCHYWPLNSMAEPSKANGMVDNQGKADALFYGRPDVRENHFGNKPALPSTAPFDPATAHEYPDATTTFNYVEGGTNPAPQFTPPAGN